MFRLGLKRLLDPVSAYLERRWDVAPPMYRTVLRPPGALPEQAFLDTCQRCGNCGDVCPARAIRPISSDDPERAGTPYINPDSAACVVCDELACMKVCPSGALRLVDRPGDIRMGLARVQTEHCLRTRGQDCVICVEKCPFGTSAIDISDGGEIEVKPAGCVGCGVCQFYCPTQPKAILVEPHGSRSGHAL